MCPGKHCTPEKRSMISNMTNTRKRVSENAVSLNFSRKMVHKALKLVQENKDYLSQNKSKAPASHKTIIE